MLQLACQAMRTRFELVLSDAGDPARLRAAGEEALAEISQAEALLSIYRDDAELFRVNALAASSAIRVDGRLFGLLQNVQELCRATGGAVDMAIGALLRCWNLGGMAAGEPGRIPEPEQIQQARSLCGMREHLLLDAQLGTVRLSSPGVSLDPGSIGKGYALDQAGAVLRSQGMRRVLMHGGTSSVIALGAPARQSAWTVAIRHPHQPQSHIARAALADAALSVSACHGRSFLINGQRFGHIIDPRTGWPVQGNLLAAVIHPLALTCDALSTALLVLGEPGLAILASGFPEADLLLVRGDPTGGAVTVDTVGENFVCSQP